jgi:hypothetical protein
LVGRREELGRIAQARRHGAGGVLLVGEPGVGKTSLATEALAEAQDEGSVTARAVATRAAADIPLGALAPRARAAGGNESPGRRAAGTPSPRRGRPARCCWSTTSPPRRRLGRARAPGGGPPALAGLDAATPLTDREREVALIAALGVDPD